MTAAVPHRQARAPRIFWLGMHKILVETEFRLLQDMGYEVFRPPYLTDVVDHSASLSLDFGNADLPPDVWVKLTTYNFFYNTIDSAIGEILNTYFDALVVTINPHWLKEALKVFDGTVIYRCYGQLGPLSRSLEINGCRPLVASRDNFHFWPHAPECVEDEDDWLAELATVVPYWLTADVLAMSGTWTQAERERLPSVALSCPNITNVYYNAHFRYLKRFFEERCFRYYGVQVEPNADPNVVGTLPRAQQLSRFARESGFLYTYRERTVCYLPPIEMMILGGPVIFLPGSLLSRYFEIDAPGRARDEAHAVAQAKRLISGDRGFIAEIVESQAPIVHRYTPGYGEMLFKAEFERVVPLSRHGSVSALPTVGPARPVLLLAHGEAYAGRNSQFSSSHGMPRAMGLLVRALNENRVSVAVTHGRDNRALIADFFASATAEPERVTTVDVETVMAQGRGLANGYSYAIVPHSHLLPDALDLPVPILAYIPAYLPHFFAGRDWFDESEADVDRGRRLAARARRVLAHSAFSASYLPQCKLRVPAEKITALPLPFVSRRASVLRGAESPGRIAVLANEPFVFYPTQPQPHKRLDLLIMAWLLLNTGEEPPVRLVLTARELPAKLAELVAASSMTHCLHLFPELDDDAVEWLYANARCLALSSELEGTVPPQLLEALHHRCPVVCSDNPLLASELGPLVQFLQVAPFGDVPAFAERLATCVHDRESALRRQSLAERQILDRFSYDRFKSEIVDLHRLMIMSPEELDG